jgi:hypothetical protein
LRKEKSRSYLIWSRPLPIGTAIGSSRFGGVVAMLVDVTVFFNRVAPSMHGQFQILLDEKSFYYLSWNERQAFEETPITVPGNVHFSLRVPQRGVQQSTGTAAYGAAVTKQKDALRLPDSKELSQNAPHGPSISDKQELLSDSENGVESSADHGIKLDNVSGRRGGSIGAFLRIAGIVALFLVAFCLWLIISTLRRRQPSRLSNDSVMEQQPPTLASDAEDALQGPSDDLIQSEDEKPAEVRPSYADIPSFAPAAFVPPAVAPEEPEAEYQGEPFSPPARDEASEKPVEEGQEIRDIAVQQVHDEIAAEIRAKITDDQRNEIYKNELESMASAIRQRLIDTEMTGLIEELRQQFARELHQDIVETMAASIEEQERAAVEKEVSEKIRAVEYESIVTEQRERLAESVRTKLAEEESASLAAAAKEKLRNEIYETVREGAGEMFAAEAREEMAAEIRATLLEKEKDSIILQQRGKLEAELYGEVSQQQRDAIRESVIKEITEEERQRIESGLRKRILEEERNRIIAQEAPAMRRQIQAQLRNEELDALRQTVRDEIYSETVQAIKRNLEDEYRTVVQEKVVELTVHLKKKAKSDIRTAMKADYDRLIEHIEHLAASIANIEALQSLSQTITLLSDEKKKYKYLNLNTAQTESLLEYLKRVQNRFNIFFDKMDEAVRELMLKLNSVKNKVDSNE